MKKLILSLGLVLILCGTVFGDRYGNVYHEVQVKDEVGMPVTTITSVEIYAPSSTTDAVIYKGANKQLTITLPMTTTSDNTTLVDGVFSWWGPSDYAYSITDGNNVIGTANHRNRTASEGPIVFPSYIVAISSTTYLDAATITMGTSLDWVINAGTTPDLITFTPLTDSTSIFSVGTTAKTADFRTWGATAGYDMQWDASRNMLAFRDSAVLGIGGAATSAAADFTIYHTADTLALTITAVVADQTVHFGDGTIATDVIFQNTTVAGSDVWWDDSEEEWNFGGASTLGVDVKTWGTTASTYMLWDESDDELEFILADLKITEGSQIEFVNIGDGLTDWVIDIATDETLLFLPTEITDDQIFAIGNATYTSDFRLFGATASTVAFDASGDLVTFTDYDVLISDADYLYFGADKDFALHSTTTKYLTFTPLAATDDYGVTLGVDQSGVDLQAFGATTGESVTWDASADSLTTVGDLALFTMTGTTVPFRVDATGTVASGNAIELETTSGPIQILADGSTTGNITIDAQNTITIVSTDADATGIYLHANGGASETIKLHSDQGTGDESIILDSDVGGITLNANAGSIDIEAVGATVGDLRLISGDTMTVQATTIIDVAGALNEQTTYCTFGSNPICMTNDGSDCAGAASETDFMIVDGTNFEFFTLTAGTQAIKFPVQTALGLNLRLDATDDEGMELGEGITASSKSAFTVGTDAFYLKVSFYVTDVNDFDILAVGFRLAEAYNQDLYAYNTYAGINVNNGTINGIWELNGSDANETDLGETWADTETHTLEVRISAAKAVTQLLDGAAVTTPLAFSWTDADTVVPFFQILGDATAAGEVAIQSWECGLQY